MQPNSSYGNYKQFRAKNANNPKTMKRPDIQELNQISKTLESLTFKKKAIRQSIKPTKKPSYQVIEQEEEEDLFQNFDNGRQKQEQSNRKTKSKKLNQSLSQLALSFNELKRDKSKKGKLQKSFDMSPEPKQDSLNLTDRPSGNRIEDEYEERKMSQSMAQKSAMMSTTNNSVQQANENLRKKNILQQIQQLYKKIEEKQIPIFEAKKIMGIIANLNSLLNDI